MLHACLLLILAAPPDPSSAYEVRPVLPHHFDQLDVVGPGLVAACAPQRHGYQARCQGAPVRFLDLAGKPVGPTEPVVIEYRSPRVLVFSAPAIPAAGQPLSPNAPRRWGLLTTDGKFHLPPKWRRIQFLGPRALAYTTEVPCPAPPPGVPAPAQAMCLKTGLIDLERRGALLPLYDVLLPDNQAPYAFSTGRGRWGYVDDAGRELVSPTFDATARCADGLCRATKGDLTVFFDRAGRRTMVRTVLPVEDFSGGLAAFRMRDGRHGFLDRAGRVAIDARYQAVGEFHDGLAPVMVGIKGGYVDRLGKLVTPLKWTEVEDFSDGFGRTVLESVDPDGRRHTRTALYDRTGRRIFEGSGRITYYVDGDRLVLYDPQRVMHGVVDPSTARLVVPLVFRRVEISPAGLIAAVDPAKRMTLLDRAGRTLLPAADRGITFNHAGVIVTTAGASPRSVLLSPDGRRRLTARPYDQLAGWDRVPHLGTFRRGTSGQPGTVGGLMDAQGRERCTLPGATDGEFVTDATPVLEFRYHRHHSTGAFRHEFASDGLVKFRVAGKWGLYDLDCREVSLPVWEELALMREGLLPAKSGGRWGLLKISAFSPSL